MHSFETEAIILATSDHGESDRLITLMTRTGGRIKGIAKGARRSQRRVVHAFEPLSLVLLQYRERSGASLAWVESCKLLEPHMILREDLDRWGYAALLAEITVEMVPERLPQEELFVLLKGALAHLEADKDAVNVVILALFRILAALGYVMDLAVCSSCRAAVVAPGLYWLHLARGQLLCTRHDVPTSGYVSIDLGTLALLSRARQLSPEHLWRLRINQAAKGKLLVSLLEVCRAHLGREIKSVKFLRDLGVI